MWSMLFQRQRRKKINLSLLFLVYLGFLFSSCTPKVAKKEEFPPKPTPKEEVTKAEEAKPEVTEEKPTEGLLPFNLKMIHFDFDRYDIRPQDAEILKENARILKSYPQTKVRLEGHCDERGTTEYNLALGERRAISARNYLIDLGIAPHRLSTVSYGEERPLDPASNEEAWAKNRRVELIPVD